MPIGQLEASITLVNQKVKFEGTAGGKEVVVIDYIPPVGDGEGYMSLELFLISFASCAGTSVISLLRRMGKNITGFKVNAKGTRREVHPTGFETIRMEFIIHSKDIEEENVKKALQLSEESICPVWAMIKNNVEVATEFTVI